MACTLEMLSSTAYLSQQDKITLAVHGHDKVNEGICLRRESHSLPNPAFL
jgi:hypothetical protein